MNRAKIVRKTHCQKSQLTLSNPAYRAWVVQHTLDEYTKDVGSGDITTRAYFSYKDHARAHIVAKENGILAGVGETQFFAKHFKKMHVRFLKKDGERVRAGEVIARLNGSVFDLMKTERVILNVLGRMSGISTYTNRFVRAAQKINPKIIITPTRKTLWGFLDKRACVLGGGGTHRLSLYNAILIKHNHQKASGVSINEYLSHVILSLSRHGIGKPQFIEVEVRNEEDALSAAKTFSHFKLRQIPCFVMFDNMAPVEVAKAIRTIKNAKVYKDVLFEASGRINEKTLSAFARTGVDVLSIGAITHSAPMLDLSMRME